MTKKKNHPRGAAKNQFCGFPDPAPCQCGNNYVEICKPSWANVTFKRKRKQSSYDKKYEAHHVLCVSVIRIETIENSGIDKSVRQTKWCINNVQNMIAMPLWGHTVRWYTDNPGMVPGFKDLPQHDWDHNGECGYTKEVGADLRALAKNVKEVECDADPLDLAEDLNDLSRKWKGEISTRGKRGGAWGAGTHDGWKAGLKGNTDWYKPFSMASCDNMTKMNFPIRNFDEKLNKALTRMANAIMGKP